VTACVSVWACVVKGSPRIPSGPVCKLFARSLWLLYPLLFSTPGLCDGASVSVSVSLSVSVSVSVSTQIDD